MSSELERQAEQIDKGKVTTPSIEVQKSASLLGTSMRDVQARKAAIYKMNPNSMESKGMVSSFGMADLGQAEFEDFDYKGLDKGIVSGDSQNEVRAQNQGFGGELATGLVKIGTEVVLGTLSSTALIPQTVAQLMGAQSDYSNSISEALDSYKADLNERFGKTYVSKENQGFSPGSWEYWMENSGNLATTVSLMIPTWGFTKILGATAKVLKLEQRAMALARTANTGSKMGKAVSSTAKWAISEPGKQVLTGMAAATFSRNVESTMEASQTYKETFESFKDFDDKGNFIGFKIDPKTGKRFTEAEVGEFSGKAATSNYTKNWAMVAQDYLMYSHLFKTADAARRTAEAVKKGALKTVGGAVLGMASEGAEEGFQYISSKESIDTQLVKAGIKKDSNWTDRYSEYINDDEFKSSVLQGAVGGGVFQAFGALQKMEYNKSMEANRKAIEAIHKTYNASMVGDAVSFEADKREAFINSVIDKARLGAVDLIETDLDYMLNDTDANIEAQGHNPKEFRENVQKIQDLTDKVAKEYNKLEADPTIAKELVAPLTKARMDVHLAEELSPIISEQREELLKKDQALFVSENAALAQSFLDLKKIRTSPEFSTSKEAQAQADDIVKGIMSRSTKYSTPEKVLDVITTAQDEELLKLNTQEAKLNELRKRARTLTEDLKDPKKQEEFIAGVKAERQDYEAIYQETVKSIKRLVEDKNDPKTSEVAVAVAMVEADKYIKNARANGTFTDKTYEEAFKLSQAKLDEFKASDPIEEVPDEESEEPILAEEEYDDEGNKRVKKDVAKSTKPVNTSTTALNPQQSAAVDNGGTVSKGTLYTVMKEFDEEKVWKKIGGVSKFVSKDAALASLESKQGLTVEQLDNITTFEELNSRIDSYVASLPLTEKNNKVTLIAREVQGARFIFVVQDGKVIQKLGEDKQNAQFNSLYSRLTSGKESEIATTIISKSQDFDINLGNVADQSMNLKLFAGYDSIKPFLPNGKLYIGSRKDYTSETLDFHTPSGEVISINAGRTIPGNTYMLMVTPNNEKVAIQLREARNKDAKMPDGSTVLDHVMSIVNSSEVQHLRDNIKETLKNIDPTDQAQRSEVLKGFSQNIIDLNRKLNTVLVEHEVKTGQVADKNTFEYGYTVVGDTLHLKVTSGTEAPTTDINKVKSIIGERFVAFKIDKAAESMEYLQSAIENSWFTTDIFPERPWVNTLLNIEIPSEPATATVSTLSNPAPVAKPAAAPVTTSEVVTAITSPVVTSTASADRDKGIDVAYFLNGKDRTYTVVGDVIYNDKGVEVFKEENHRVRKAILALANKPTTTATTTNITGLNLAGLAAATTETPDIIPIAPVNENSFSPENLLGEMNGATSSPESIEGIVSNIVKNKKIIPYTTIVYDETSTNGTRRENGESTIIDLAERKLVVLEVNGINIPFYLSTGHGGKVDVTSGKWYPIFGISSDGWMNKLSGSEINNYYGSETLKSLAEELDRQIGDIRSDNTIPKAGISGLHSSFINRDLTPTENGLSTTRDSINKNIEKVKNIVAKLNTVNDNYNSTIEGKDSTVTANGVVNTGRPTVGRKSEVGNQKKFTPATEAYKDLSDRDRAIVEGLSESLPEEDRLHLGNPIIREAITTALNDIKSTANYLTPIEKSKILDMIEKKLLDVKC